MAESSPTSSCDMGCSVLLRKKTLPSDLMSTELTRCLGVRDVMFFGVGATVGLSVFIVVGQVVHYDAGISSVLSYLMAGVFILLSALCFIECSTLLPLIGSSYTYCYVIFGELVALLVGWTSLLGLIMGVSVVAKGWSGTLDSMVNNSLSEGIKQSIGGFHNDNLSDYIDFMAVAIIIVGAIIVGIGTETSSNMNTILACVKGGTVCVIIVAGFIFADTSNWTDKKNGGFMPKGMSGIVGGAASAFFCYTGIDNMLYAIAETKEPKKTLPIATILTISISGTVYILAILALTLLVPYYDVNPNSPFPGAFAKHGQYWVSYIVGIGTLLGLGSSMVSYLFPLTRTLYTFAKDGLMFNTLAYIHPKTQTPLVSLAVAVAMTTLVAAFLNILSIIRLFSLSVLCSYSMTAACVIFIRYDPPSSLMDTSSVTPRTDSDTTEKCEHIPLKGSNKRSDMESLTTNPPACPPGNKNTAGGVFKTYRGRINNLNRTKLLTCSLLVMVISSVSLFTMTVHAHDYLLSGTWWTMILLFIEITGITIPFVIIWTLEQHQINRDCFKVPLVPIVPLLSIVYNIGVLTTFSWLMWVEMMAWLLIGFIFYLAYGLRHSQERLHRADDCTSSGYTELTS